MQIDMGQTAWARSQLGSTGREVNSPFYYQSSGLRSFGPLGVCFLPPGPARAALPWPAHTQAKTVSACGHDKTCSARGGTLAAMLSDFSDEHISKNCAFA